MPFLGEIASLITALLWACSSVVFTEASKRIGSNQINLDRLIVSSLMLLATILIIGNIAWPLPQQSMFLILSGMVGLIMGDGFLFKAFKLIGARYSMLIMSFVPAISAILAYFFLHEALSWLVILGMTLTLTGIIIVVTDRTGGAPKNKLTFSGGLYAFLGALGQAIGLLWAKSAFASGEINGFMAAFVRIASSTIVFLPVMMFVGKYRNPVKVYSNDKKSLYLTMAGSILGPYLGITFSLLAVKNTDVGIASTLMATVPILMLPVLRITYKEKITFRSLVGSVVTVSGVAVLFIH
ncbi:MAG: DMT family transporter [Ignavibacteria bacterium]|nr:DMT family transporter [Ignavibacteria bacterium]